MHESPRIIHPRQSRRVKLRHNNEASQGEDHRSEFFDMNQDKNQQDSQDFQLKTEHITKAHPHYHNLIRYQESIEHKKCIGFLIPLTFCSYAARSRIIRAAASPFKGSEGLGYKRSCGRRNAGLSCNIL